MYEHLNAVAEIISTKIEKPTVLYKKYIPKPIRFALVPLSQCLLMMVYILAVLMMGIISLTKGVYNKIKELYHNYE